MTAARPPSPIAPATSAPARPSVTPPSSVPRRLDLVARGVMALNAVLTLGAFATGIMAMTSAGDDRLMVEGWRTFGYLAFAAMWALLAVAPRRVPGIWEIVLLQKTLVTIWALAILGAPEASTSAAIDAWLVVSTAVAYVVCRGWVSWRGLRESAPSPRWSS